MSTEAELKALRAFAKDVLLSGGRWCGGNTGPYLRSRAVHHKLVALTDMPAPCDDQCLCKSEGLQFPRMCYQWTPVMGKGRIE